MINYYIRTEGVHVKINSETKEIINVVNTSNQKTISLLNGDDYYNTIMNHTLTWTISNEIMFNSNFTEVLNSFQL